MRRPCRQRWIPRFTPKHHGDIRCAAQRLSLNPSAQVRWLVFNFYVFSTQFLLQASCSRRCKWASWTANRTNHVIARRHVYYLGCQSPLHLLILVPSKSPSWGRLHSHQHTTTPILPFPPLFFSPRHIDVRPISTLHLLSRRTQAGHQPVLRAPAPYAIAEQTASLACRRRRSVLSLLPWL